MTTKQNGFFSRLCQAAAALGGSPEPESAAGTTPPDEPSRLKSHIRTLELDIEERETRIKTMQKEFDHFSRQAERDREGAGSAEIQALAKRLAPILSQVPTMRAMHAEGAPVRQEDLLRLFEKVERILQETGLTPIGQVGESVRFDSRLHQRMSGGDLSDGGTVQVRFVGYHINDVILTKALVSRED
jgi:molecular chaperone GrpE (heat shock protein)